MMKVIVQSHPIWKKGEIKLMSDNDALMYARDGYVKILRKRI